MSQATLEPFDVEAMAGELRAFTAEVAATCPRLQVMVRPGAAAPVILDLARGLGADLLVLGTHGRSGFRKLVLGSVAEKVVRKAPCPVLTVPCAVEGHPDKPVFEHVLCGVDFLETSQRAVEYAVSLAEEANGRLTLLHTIEWVPDERRPTHTTFGLNLYRQAVLTEARARLAELVPAEARDWCQIDMRVACGEPSVEILRAAAAERADLVVLGAGHQGPIDRMLFGADDAAGPTPGVVPRLMPTSHRLGPSGSFARAVRVRSSTRARSSPRWPPCPAVFSDPPLRDARPACRHRFRARTLRPDRRSTWSATWRASIGRPAARCRDRSVPRSSSSPPTATRTRPLSPARSWPAASSA